MIFHIIDSGAEPAQQRVHMYVNEIYLHNSGPTRKLHIKFEFGASGRPLPTLIVGKNGAGKTNLLSILTESLLMTASKPYDDVLKLNGFGRSFFRILGGTVVTAGEKYGFSIVKLTSNTESDSEPEHIYFHEKAGDISPEDAKKFTPSGLHDGIRWNSEKLSKDVAITDDKARKIVDSGIYVYFPYSRSETPYWLNTDSIDASPAPSFAIEAKYSNLLGRSMHVERSLDRFSQWLLSAIAEARMPVLNAEYVDKENKAEITYTCDTAPYMQTQAALLWANQILSLITGQQSSFFWAGRHSNNKLGITIGDRKLGGGLRTLSGGEATLLSIFGTILQDSDSLAIDPAQLEGIVVIDELDAHVHLDLQLNALPVLMSLFPKVQFVISTHSPFLALGLETQFSDGVSIVELPSGNRIDAESYAEFRTALNALQETKEFVSRVNEKIREFNGPVILLAGETDEKYFEAAARALGFESLVGKFQWIGRADEQGGGKNTGDGALDKAVAFIESNPSLFPNEVIALYDCDANKKKRTDGRLHVLPINQVEDAYCSKGIENLLPRDVFKEEFYEHKKVPSGYGPDKILPELRKMALCDRICENSATPTDVFDNFRPVLEELSCLLGMEPAQTKDQLGDQAPPPDRPSPSHVAG